LNAITGTQFLDGVEQLEIQQVIDLSTRTYLAHHAPAFCSKKNRAKQEDNYNKFK